jgi:phosphatidylserine/phosphatidylglycerophosphate/cardiolipin synthase-like enzyme
MKRSTISLILLLLLSFPSCQAQETPKAPQALPPIEVYFSPKGGCTEAVVKEINAAQKMILVQAYSFTSVPIAKALVDAHKRGVQIKVITGYSKRVVQHAVPPAVFLPRNQLHRSVTSLANNV